MITQAPLREILVIADEAVGVRVLTDLYEEMRNQPLPNEVDSLWLKLGVSGQPGAVKFDDNAPLANIRRTLTVMLN